MKSHPPFEGPLSGNSDPSIGHGARKEEGEDQYTSKQSSPTRPSWTASGIRSIQISPDKDFGNLS
jgi:hypothetical protein